MKLAMFSKLVSSSLISFVCLSFVAGCSAVLTIYPDAEPKPQRPNKQSKPVSTKLAEAAEQSSNDIVANLTYLERPEVIEFIDQLVQEDRFEREWLEEILGDAKFLPRVVELLDRTPEGTWNWAKYSKHLLDQPRIEKGIKFYRENTELLHRAEAEFGVPASVIVAILGVETRYGTIMGRTRILDSLMTIGFDYPRRASYFKKELRHFLLMSREEQMDPRQVRGSYAGAMGYGQFMPSSYRKLAVDFDADGVRDLFNPIDAVGSIGHYLKENGWEADKPIIEKAWLINDIDDENIMESYNKIRIRPEWRRDSLRKYFSKEFDETPSLDPIKLNATRDHVKVGIFKYEGVNGDEYWLSHHNFHVIGKYNISRLYSMAVFQLSEKILQGVQQ